MVTSLLINYGMKMKVEENLLGRHNIKWSGGGSAKKGVEVTSRISCTKAYAGNNG
jgi:hypothetical protein